VIDLIVVDSLTHQEELLLAARRVLGENVFIGSFDTGYTAASGKMKVPWDQTLRFLYPFQWLWDTFFIAGWTDNITQGITDIDKFLNGQRSDGFLGHIRYNREILSRKEYFPPPEIYYPEGLPPEGEIISKITQPPNVAYGVFELAKKMPAGSPERREFLLRAFPKIMAYHRFIYKNLCVEGLMVIIHPWQAGDDNSPKWDEAYENIRNGQNLTKIVTDWLDSMKISYDRVDLKLVDPSQRPIDSHYDIYLYLIYLYGQWGWEMEKILADSPFRILDPMTNSILLRSNLALIGIAKELEMTENLDEISLWTDTTARALDRLWNQRDKIYYAFNLESRSQIRVKTVSSLSPLFSQIISKERAFCLAGHIENEFKNSPQGSFSFPSTFFSEKNFFSEKRYWRGPVWPIMNTIVAEGLQFYGFSNLAERLKNDALSLVTKSMENGDEGFYEYYDSLTGEGLGSPKQSWTAAAVVKLLDFQQLGKSENLIEEEKSFFVPDAIFEETLD
jgi:hypothetical protein